MYLKEARKNINAMEGELSKLSKAEKAYTKKEIAQHREQIVAEIDEIIENIDKECEALMKNFEKYRKQFCAKSVFLRRHNKMM